MIEPKKRVFITGDRSNAVVYPALVAVEMLRVQGAGHGLATGSCATGVEALVRQLGAMAGVDVEVVHVQDLDLRHALLAAREDVAEIVAVHVEPMSSTVVKSLMAAVPDEQLRLVSLPDLMV